MGGRNCQVTMWSRKIWSIEGRRGMEIIETIVIVGDD